MGICLLFSHCLKGDFKVLREHRLVRGVVGFLKNNILNYYSRKMATINEIRKRTEYC